MTKNNNLKKGVFNHHYVLCKTATFSLIYIYSSCKQYGLKWKTYDIHVLEVFPGQVKNQFRILTDFDIHLNTTAI